MYFLNNTYIQRFCVCACIVFVLHNLYLVSEFKMYVAFIVALLKLVGRNSSQHVTCSKACGIHRQHKKFWGEQDP